MAINRATLRAVQLMELLAANPDGLSLTVIAERLDLPKASVFGIMQALVETYMVRKTKRKYYVGFKSKMIGDMYRVTHDLYGLANEPLTALSKKYDVSTSVSTLTPLKLDYIFQCNASSSRVYIGTNVPVSDLHTTASGKVILAHLPEEESDAFINKLVFSALTPTTILSEEALRAVFKDIRKQQYAVDNGEFMANLHCVAVPVFCMGKVIGALTCSTLKLLERTIFDAMLEDLKELGHAISSKIA